MADQDEISQSSAVQVQEADLPASQDSRRFEAHSILQQLAAKLDQATDVRAIFRILANHDTDVTDAVSKARGELYKKEITEAPSDWVSVYHFTNEAGITGIEKDGHIKLMRKLSAAEIADRYKDPRQRQRYQEMVDFEEYIDTVAKGRFSHISRMQSVFAHLNPVNELGKGNICVEIKVDPEKAMVTNADLFAEASWRQDRPDEKKYWSELYWDNAISLNEFLALDPKEQATIFSSPEVLIPVADDAQGLDLRYARILNAAHKA